MDQDTIEKWASIGGFSDEVRQMFETDKFQKLTITSLEQSITLAQESNATLHRILATAEETAGTRDQIIAHLERMVTLQAETIATLRRAAPGSALRGPDGQIPGATGRSLASAREFQAARTGGAAEEAPC